MGLRDHLNFKKAGQVLKDAQKDTRRPKDEVAARREQNHKRQGGGKK